MMAVDPLIAAVFGPAPAGLDFAGDRRPGDNAAVIVLIAIATIAVGLRIVVRFMQQSSFKADDYAIMLALVSFILSILHSVPVTMYFHGRAHLIVAL